MYCIVFVLNAGLSNGSKCSVHTKQKLAVQKRKLGDASFPILCVPAKSLLSFCYFHYTSTVYYKTSL